MFLEQSDARALKFGAVVGKLWQMRGKLMKMLLYKTSLDTKKRQNFTIEKKKSNTK